MAIQRVQRTADVVEAIRATISSYDLYTTVHRSLIYSHV